MAQTKAKSDPARVAAAKRAWITIRARYGPSGRSATPLVKTVSPKPKMKKLEPIKMPKKAETVSTKDMMLNTVILLVTINGIGNYRKVDTDSLNITDADTDEEVNKEWIGVHRKLMKAEELKKIQSICNKAKAYVFNRGLPFSLKSGIYLLPRVFQEEMAEKLEGFIAEMQPHIHSLAKRLPEYKKEAMKAPQFKEADFPTVEKIRSAFHISYQFLHIDSAQGLSKKLHEEQLKKTEAIWAETRELGKQVLRAEMAEKVNHFIERLKPGQDGKRKIFRDGMTEKFMEFLQTFDPRNGVVGDAKLAILVSQAKSLLQDANPDALRDHDDFRDHIRHGFETIKAILDPMVTVKPSRRITFAEDE